MEPCVLNALMAKNGIQKFQLVLANQVIDGTGNFVKNLMFVQTVEYGTQHINNVSALIIPIGVDMLVYLLKNVQGDNILTQQFKNVHAFQDIIGMVEFVYNVPMEELGISLHQDAHALQAQLKLEMDVDSNKYVAVEKNGFKTLGLANVLFEQFGMVTFVQLILVYQGKSGMNH